MTRSRATGFAHLVIRLRGEPRILFVRIQFALAVFLINAAIAPAAELQEVASFPDKQITGVGVSTRSGRIFVNFPYWSDDHSISVAEIVNGQPKAFPNDEWNKSAVGRTRGGELGPPVRILSACKAWWSMIRITCGSSIQQRQKCRRSLRADRSW